MHEENEDVGFRSTVRSFDCSFVTVGFCYPILSRLSRRGERDFKITMKTLLSKLPFFYFNAAVIIYRGTMQFSIIDLVTETS